MNNQTTTTTKTKQEKIKNEHLLMK